MNQDTEFRKAKAYLENTEHHLTYCLTRKLKTRVGKNVLWNVKTALFHLRNAKTLLEKSYDSQKVKIRACPVCKVIFPEQEIDAHLRQEHQLVKIK